MEHLKKHPEFWNRYILIFISIFYNKLEILNNTGAFYTGFVKNYEKNFINSSSTQ